MKAIFSNAIANEIENGVMSYTFNSEAETEAAVMECITNGIKFHTAGRCSLVVCQAPTETEKEENETLDRLKSELQEYHNNASKGGADRERNMQWLQEDIKKLEQKKEANTTITASITEDGNKCEYTHNGKVLASITYRKEFDKYDVNTPSVGYMTDNVTEAHKACESGINYLLNTAAVFDYSAVERYNAVNYPEAI